MKRYLGILVLIIASSLVCQTAHGEMECWAVGDLDGNGSINVTDLVILSSFLWGGGPEPVRLRLADLDGDGDIDATDFTLLQLYLFFGCDSCLGDLDKYCEDIEVL